VLRAEGTQLRAQWSHRELAAERLDRGSYRPVMNVAIPLDALADFAGRDESPVILESAAPDRAVARWEGRGIPQVREYDVTAVDCLGAMPELPVTWASGPGDLLEALAEATETGDPNCSRYDLSCVQLGGTRNPIVATDGRQVLVRLGFRFPWDGDLLIKGSPIFGRRALPCDQPVEVGKSTTSVVFRIGDWTIWSEIQTDARFPAVDRVIPEAVEVVTQLRLDPADARFLGPALNRLPGRDDQNGPLTIDLNGQVVLRASARAQPHQVAELVLNRSSYTGPPLCVVIDREFLDRTLRLGFGEIGFAGVERPFVCRNQRSVYAVQPLTGGAPLEPEDIVTRIESSAVSSDHSDVRTHTETLRKSMRERAPRIHHSPADSVASNGLASAQNWGTTVPDLIQEAEALYAALAHAKSRTTRLITGLRRYRKQTRMVSKTLKSLRKLKSQDVVA
jgi:hypothetical protein